MDGNIYTYKARLVEKSRKHWQRADFDEIFSPVAMLKSIRILLVIATNYEYEIQQLNIKTALLDENLQEEVYITHLEDFESKDANKVWKLDLSIYGLKQNFKS